jgi:hypothetical protein
MLLNSSERNARRPRVQAKNLVLLVAIVGIFMAVAAFFRVEVSHDTYIRWGGLILTVTVIFGILVRRSPKFYHLTSFWILVAIFVSLNLVAFGALVTSVLDWRLPWFGLMLIEVPVFISLLEII